MKYRVIVLPEAKNELREGIAWYNSQKKGLGRKFATAVKNVLHGLRSFPRRHEEVFQDARRAPVIDFPYVVYYRVIQKQVHIFSIFFGERDPSEWQERA